MKWIPDRKIMGVVGLGAPIASILIGLLNVNGIEFPEGFEGAVGAVIAGVLGYFIPNKEE